MPPRLPRLLAVINDVTITKLIEDAANICGYEGFITSDSLGVVNLSNALKPEIIAVDISMSSIDANALFSALIVADYEGEVLIIGDQQDDTLQTAQRSAELRGLNVRAALEKPFDSSMLQKILAPEKTAA